MEQRRTLRIERPCLLLVEGEDDRAALEPLIQFIGLYGAIQVVPVGGKHEFARVIKALCELPDFDVVVQSLGVVCDDDAPPKNTCSTGFSSGEYAGNTTVGTPTAGTTSDRCAAAPSQTKPPTPDARHAATTAATAPCKRSIHAHRTSPVNGFTADAK